MAELSAGTKYMRRILAEDRRLGPDVALAGQRWDSAYRALQRTEEAERAAVEAYIAAKAKAKGKL